MIATHDDPRDQDVKLFNCAGCDAELLSPDYLDGLKGTNWGAWPPLAFRLFQHNLVVKLFLWIGQGRRPFCSTCVGAGRHEVVRQQHADRFPVTGAL